MEAKRRKPKVKQKKSTAKSLAAKRYAAKKRKTDTLRRTTKLVNGEGNLARFMRH